MGSLCVAKLTDAPSTAGDAEAAGRSGFMLLICVGRTTF